jgi:hypothetical protein
MQKLVNGLPTGTWADPGKRLTAGGLTSALVLRPLGGGRMAPIRRPRFALPKKESNTPALAAKKTQLAGCNAG